MGTFFEFIHSLPIEYYVGIHFFLIGCLVASYFYFTDTNVILNDTFSSIRKANKFYKESGLTRDMYTPEENLVHLMDTGKMKYDHASYIKAKKKIKERNNGV